MRPRQLASTVFAIALLVLMLTPGATAQCPAEGDCCVAHPTPGCNDGACCSAVCAQDPLCCAAEWDEDCVAAAEDICKCVPAPGNDDCANAVPIGDGATAYNNMGATDFGPDASCGVLGADVWFSYVPACDGSIIVSTCSQADYDTLIAAYSGNCASLTEIACNDDAPGCGSLTSEMTVPVTEGEMVLLRIGGWNGETGTGVVSVTPNPPCVCPGEGDCCSANGTAGCDDEACCTAVCVADVFCCTVEWDASCANDAVFLCDGTCGPPPSGDPVALDFNWNGMVHSGESADPDSPDGYRSISDRGLASGTANSLGGETGAVDGLLSYGLVDAAGDLDTVFIGGPRDAGNGFIGFDTVINGDTIGVAPAWDPTGGTAELESASSTIDPVDVTEAFALGLLYNASVGGGTFDLTLEFASGLQVTVTLGVPDWFADFDPFAPPPGPGVAVQQLLDAPLSGGDGFAGTASTDSGTPGSPLNTVEALLTLGSLQDLGDPLLGETLTGITFSNAAGGNANMTVGIYAASVVTGVEVPCPADVDGSGIVDVADLVAVILAWGPCGEPCPEDIDGNDAVDVGDLVEVILQWGPCP